MRSLFGATKGSILEPAAINHETIWQFERKKNKKQLKYLQEKLKKNANGVFTISAQSKTHWAPYTNGVLD